MEEAVRISRIVNNLRVFSRSGMQRKSIFSLGALLDSILDQIGHQMPLENYRVMREYRGTDQQLEGDEDQLRQVFTNLILNGLQAMPGGGELEVCVEPDPLADHMRVIVQDHGNGIREEELGKLFTPFFSTKPYGTGLGLALSYGIVRDHGGEILVKSLSGAGSTFTVLLPLRQGQPSGHVS